MKKSYQKPIVMIEKFLITNMVAAGCEAKVTSLDPDTCRSEDPFIADALELRFFAETGVCDFPIDGDTYEGICYHGAPDNNIFSS